MTGRTVCLSTCIRQVLIFLIISPFNIKVKLSRQASIREKLSTPMCIACGKHGRIISSGPQRIHFKATHPCFRDIYRLELFLYCSLLQLNNSEYSPPTKARSSDTGLYYINIIRIYESASAFTSWRMAESDSNTPNKYEDAFAIHSVRINRSREEPSSSPPM